MRKMLLLVLLAACPGATVPGAACRADSDCSSLKGGYCAKIEICTRACDETAVCPAHSTCVSEGSRRVCLASCTTNSDCMKGFGCHALAEGNVCEYIDPLGPPPA